MSLSRNHLFQLALHDAHAVANDADVRQAVLQHHRVKLRIVTLVGNLLQLLQVKFVPALLVQRNGESLLNVKGVTSA